MSLLKKFYGQRKASLVADYNKFPEKTNYIDLVIKYIPNDDELLEGVVHINGKDKPVFTIEDDSFNNIVTRCKAFIDMCYSIKIKDATTDITPGYYINKSLNDSETYNGEVYYLSKVAGKIYKHTLFSVTSVDDETCDFLCKEAKEHLMEKGIK